MATKTNQKVIRETKQETKQVVSLHEELINAINNFEKSKVDLAMAFFKAYSEKEQNGAYCWQNRGYSTFREYVETEFSFEYRNAMYYVKIGKTIKELKLSKEEIEEIGWSKFKELTPFLLEDTDRTTFDKIKKSIKNMTVRELRDFIEKYDIEEVKEEEAELVKKCRMTFSLTDEQIKIVKSALDKAMDKFGVENENLAIEYICAEFLSGE